MLLLPGADRLDDCLRTVRDLRNEDDVGSSGDARVERDPAGVAPHHLQDHDPAVAFRRRVQPVDGVGGHGHCGVEAEGVVGGGQIVVDRLRHGHHGDPHVAETLGNPQRPVAADGDNAFDAELADSFDHLGRAVHTNRGAVLVDGRILERIPAVRRVEQRAALRQDAADDLRGHGDDLTGKQPLEAQLDAEHFHVVVAAGSADGGANDCVEAGAIAAPSQDADPFHHGRDQITNSGCKRFAFEHTRERRSSCTGHGEQSRARCPLALTLLNSRCRPQPGADQLWED